MFLIALDASLFSGPAGHLSRPTFVKSILEPYSADLAQGILGFSGFFESCVQPSFTIGRIMSATASTTLGDPRDKTVVRRPGSLASSGADAIGLHLSLKHERSDVMLGNAGSLISEAHSLGLPALVASYVCGEGGDRPDNVAHAATVARDLGADVIKVTYPGSEASLREISESVAPSAVVIAGGPQLSEEYALKLAAEARTACSGICFGRAIFESSDPRKTVIQLGKTLHQPQGE